MLPHAGIAMRFKHLRNRAQSIVEVVSAMVVITVVCLFLLDVTMLVLLSSKLDALAKSAARSAAKEADEISARRVVVDVVRKSLHDGQAMIANVRVPRVAYQPNSKVSVELDVSAKIPVPIPGISPVIDLHARAVEPVVTVSR